MIVADKDYMERMICERAIGGFADQEITVCTNEVINRGLTYVYELRNGDIISERTVKKVV